MAIEIGKLNRRIQIQRKAGVLDDYGQESLIWTKVADCWASIKPISGREKLRAMAQESTLICTVAIRYAVALMPPTTADAWRIVYGTRILEILAAQDFEEARRFIIFDCQETGVS